MPKEIVILTKDGVQKEFTVRVAKYAKEQGWIEYHEPLASAGESLTDLKARIKAMKTMEEVNRALYEEQQRQVPRPSVIDLCNKIIAEWN